MASSENHFAFLHFFFLGMVLILLYSVMNLCPYFQALCLSDLIPLGGHKQNLVCTRTQEKGAVTAQETDPDLPVSVQESLVESWVGGDLLKGWEH